MTSIPFLLTVVGIGPGDSGHLTPCAAAALDTAETIAGYPGYLNLIPDHLHGKQIISTGMTQEIERVNAAIESTLRGSRTVILSGGDAGVYGMAGLVIEQLGKRHLESSVDLTIVPGITASNAAAAELGAPLACDYMTLSLSDLLVDKTQIQRRFRAALEADIVLVLYNPRSTRRIELLNEVIDYAICVRGEKTVCGFVKNAGRPNSSRWVGKITEFPAEVIDMSTLVVIGNSQTRMIGPWMVTARGYEKREKL